MPLWLYPFVFSLAVVSIHFREEEIEETLFSRSSIACGVLQILRCKTVSTAS